MAGIKSLAIRGIRSFGPEEGDEQRISFDRPLTLILGQNGCGKTTIIECLRYAITGQMPPGSRNECFVHDAKVSRSTEVLGQVRLKLFNAKDKQVEVQRSMKVTCLAKKKTKFQTLDSLLSVIDENGDVKDISSRCADLDSFMHEELGVSKAILNSVIFCHQEDSSWPLDEGKKVKERFDEIFDADRYSNCFEHLRKLRKENAVTVKLLTQEVQHLTEKKEELDKKKLDQVNTESRISESELKITELVAELTPVTEKLAQIKALEKDMVSLETSKEKAKTRIEHCQSQEQDLRKTITTIHEGTIKEIEDAIANYATTSKEKKKELDQSYKKITSFNKDEEKIANEKQSNELKFNKLILLESQNQERIDKRNKMIIDVSKLAEISVLEINTREEAEQGIKNITEKVKSLNKTLNEERATHDEEEKKLQADVDESRDALSRHKQKISGKESEITNVKKQLTKIEKDINDAEDSKQKLTAMEEKLKKAEDDHKAAVNELNVEETQKEIAEDEKGLETHEKELDEISEKITQLQKQSALIKERDIVEDSLKQKEKNFTVLKNKHRPAIVDLLGQMPESGFAVAINKLEADVRSEVDGMKKKLKEKQIEVTKLESERKHVREKLNDCRSELTKGEDKMYKACGTQSYSSTLSKLTSTVEKLQDEQNVLQSSMFIIAKYKTQLKDNNCCPLCSRGFENENEVTDLISQLTTQVLNVPAKLEKVTEELQRSSAKKDELLSMKSLDEKITKLKETDIPQLEGKLSDIDKKIQSANESVEELQTAMTEPELKLQTVKQVQGDMPLLDKYVQEIKTATKEVENVKAKCVNLITDLTIDDATAKKNDLRQKISTLKSRVKSAQTKINQHTKRLQKLNNEKNKLTEQLMNLQKKVQEIVNLQEKQKQLEESREQYLVELKQLEEEIPSFEAKLKEKEEIKAEAVKKNRGIIDTKRAYIIKITNAFDKVKTVEAEIQAHKERNVQAEMDKIKEANDKLTEKHKQLMVDRDTLTKRIDTLKDELAKQEIYKRDLEDNLKLKKALEELEAKQKELAEIEEKLNGLNKDILTEKEELITRHTKIYTEKAQTEGQLNELKVRMKQIKTELSKNQNKDIDKKYRQKMYELYVSKAIDSDVKDYAILLEKSLMEFHREKMENINLVIRELWRKIYRGNDIDHIEIKCESNISNDGDRRKYEYRVVQCKQGVEIDMRGRCSAGQKVLACLIIRLALAETFSSRFGILALDEPTTNLDQENISSLCTALGEIVQERMRQKNFMFIIITHDREFIDTLGSIDKVTHYYEVGRNDDGKSLIKKIRFH